MLSTFNISPFEVMTGPDEMYVLLRAASLRTQYGIGSSCTLFRKNSALQSTLYVLRDVCVSFRARQAWKSPTWNHTAAYTRYGFHDAQYRHILLQRIYIEGQYCTRYALKSVDSKRFFHSRCVSLPPTGLCTEDDNVSI